MQRWCRVFWLVSLLEVLVFGRLVLANANISNPTLSKPGELVFMVQAAKGKIIRRSGRFYLRLEQVSPQVIFLSDPPDRKAGMVQTQGFLSNYAKTSFDQSPHAALIYADHPRLGRGVKVRFEMSNPKQVDDNVWLFQMRVVSGFQAIQPRDDLTSITVIIDNQRHD